MAEVLPLQEGMPTGERIVVPDCVEALRRWLETAESGEIGGVVVVASMFDGCAMRGLDGMVGGYTMLGAAHTAIAELEDVVRGMG